MIKRKTVSIHILRCKNSNIPFEEKMTLNSPPIRPLPYIFNIYFFLTHFLTNNNNIQGVTQLIHSVYIHLSLHQDSPSKRPQQFPPQQHHAAQFQLHPSTPIKQLYPPNLHPTYPKVSLNRTPLSAIFRKRGRPRYELFERRRRVLPPPPSSLPVQECRVSHNRKHECRAESKLFYIGSISPDNAFKLDLIRIVISFAGYYGAEPTGSGELPAKS